MTEPLSALRVTDMLVELQCRGTLGLLLGEAKAAKTSNRACTPVEDLKVAKNSSS